MLEIAIVGGGLCGVALARSLRRQGRNLALFDARRRLGGRILSATCADSGLGIDLGATWFWPDSQPRISRLIDEMKLPHFTQHDDGSVLHLRDPDKTPESMEGTGVHGGARRVEGGMSRLIDSLEKDLPSDAIYLDHILTEVSDRGDRVLLTFEHKGSIAQFEAQHVVLAIPPRLLEEHVRFKPEFDGAVREAMIGADTWMAAQAKVVMSYARPSWRDAGRSGSAFVSHEQAVIGEIFDACDAAGINGALGGFIALSPELRQSFEVGLPMLMGNQIMQVFDTALEQQEQYYQDWAREPHTCSTLDRCELQREHSAFANPLLRRAFWDGKLYLGSSETASESADYLEGALSAAQRIGRSLDRSSGAAEDTEVNMANGGLLAPNAASLAKFSQWVATQSDAAFEDYHRRLTRSLSLQQREQLTQLAILGTIEAIYDGALGVLNGLAFDMSNVAVERGRSALMPEVQKPFRDVMQRLLNDAVAFNRTSCALSNFPGEHRPSEEYMQTIMRDLAAAWREFSLAANAILLSKAELSDRGTQVSLVASKAN